MADSRAWEFVKAVTRPALFVAPPTFLAEIRENLSEAGVVEAVARRDSAPIYDWLMTLVQLQGISDEVAFAYAAKHGNVRWAEVAEAFLRAPLCHRLRTYWHFNH